MLKNFLKLVFLSCFLAIPAWSANLESLPLSLLGSEQPSVPLQPYLELLEDPGRQLTIRDILTSPDLHRFNSLHPLKKAASLSNNLGFTDSAIWLRFRLNPENQNHNVLLLSLDRPSIESLAFYSPDALGIYREQKSGGDIPFSQRYINHRNPVFHIKPPFSGDAYYYLRLESRSSLFISLKLWTHEGFVAYIDSTQLAFGFYYGVMAVVLLAAIFTYLQLREALFLRYSLFLLFMIALQFAINGFGFQYIWGKWPHLTSSLNSSLICLGIIATLSFSADFLRTATQSPLSHRLYQTAYMLTISALVLIWTDYSSYGITLTIACGVALLPLVSLATVQALIKRYQPARYFALAWGIFLLGIFTAGLRFLGVVPHNILTAYAIQIASMLEIIILSLSFVGRFKSINAQRIAAEHQAGLYVQKLNSKLEDLVAERTESLEKSNAELKRLASQDSLTGLLNHRASINQVSKALGGSRRYNFAVAVIMIDLDNFKLLNDRFGHQAGDDAILSVSQVLTSNLRESDSCGRYGGEEFLLVLTHTELDEVRELGERLRESIAKVRLKKAPGAGVTASLGIAMCYPAQCSQQTTDSIISAADAALYQAKNGGRNKVCLAPPMVVSNN